MFQWLRRTFFPTPAEMMGDMARSMGGMMANLQVGVDQGFRAQGLVPCSWCKTYTHGQGGCVYAPGSNQVTAIFCSLHCRSSWEEALRREPATCNYCRNQFPGSLFHCSHCGAPKNAVR